MTDNGRNFLDLQDHRAYAVWRERKLAAAPLDADALWVTLGHTGAPDDAAVEAIKDRCRQHNLALYRGPTDAGKQDVAALGLRLGLHHLDDNLCADEDRITSLQVMDQGRHRAYIPYSDRPIQWHTDGYYNQPSQQVRAWLLHCARPAAEGGENALLDPELLYIMLRDADPSLIAALQNPKAMTIPPNIENGREIRPARSGPVFSCDASSGLGNGALHMRYTARTRSIAWRDDPDTRRAVAMINELLAGGLPYVLRLRLAAGEGVVSNNALHNRSGFRDAPDQKQTRLYYRARYYQRVAA